MKSLFYSVLDVLFPRVCSGCENILGDNENLLCSYCRFEIPKTLFLYQSDNEAFKKFYGIVPVEKAASLIYFEKNGITQQILHYLKYKNKPELGVLLANMFEDDINKTRFFSPNSCLIPVPLHSKRFKERGYNQIQLFTETLAKNHNLFLNRDLLIRTVYKKTQTTKNLTDRADFLNNMFALTSIPVNYTNFVIIDDVLTTGSTLIQCIKTLQKIPNAKISVLTIAYAHS
jgi:ComF family protein